MPGAGAPFDPPLHATDPTPSCQVWSEIVNRRNVYKIFYNLLAKIHEQKMLIFLKFQMQKYISFSFSSKPTFQLFFFLSLYHQRFVRYDWNGL